MYNHQLYDNCICTPRGTRTLTPHWTLPLKDNVSTIPPSKHLLGMWVTIPLPSVCNTDALPIELIPIILVALVGNDPTLSSMSRWHFPIKLQSNMYRARGSNSLNIGYEPMSFSAKPRHLSTRRDLNPRHYALQAYA